MQLPYRTRRTAHSSGLTTVQQTRPRRARKRGNMPKEILGVTLYNRQETADMMGISTRSIQTYTEKGLLTGQKIGARWYYTEKNIINFINGQRSQAARDKTFKPEAD